MSEPSAYFAYVGSRTTRERNARGEGISVYRSAGPEGKLLPAGDPVSTGSPVCIVFAPS